MHQALQKFVESEKHPSPALANHGNKAQPFVLRMVNIRSDLELFFQWMDDPDLKVNWGLKENSHRLNNHYQLFQQSEDRQSFLIEKSGQPLFQFDIFLIHFHELYFRIPTTTGDCILNYIICYKRDTESDLKMALSLQLDYFFTFPECRRLWLPIPEDQEVVIRIIQDAGFKFRAAYTSGHQRYGLFYLKRAEYLTVRHSNC